MIIYDCSPDGVSSGGTTLIEQIQAGGQNIAVINKTVNIPIATNVLYGVVKSSTGSNMINVLETGEMKVSTIDINTVVQNQGENLILQCGSSQD